MGLFPASGGGKRITTKDTYSLTLTADSGAIGGFYVAQEISSDVQSYGTPISASVIDSAGYICITSLFKIGSVWYLGVSGNHAGTAQVCSVTFFKDY